MVVSETRFVRTQRCFGTRKTIPFGLTIRALSSKPRWVFLELVDVDQEKEIFRHFFFLFFLSPKTLLIYTIGRYSRKKPNT